MSLSGSFSAPAPYFANHPYGSPTGGTKVRSAARSICTTMPSESIRIDQSINQTD